MKQHSNLLSTARRRIPFFPFIPLVPIGLILTNATLLVTMFRRIQRLERARAL
jgi:hypothetical protein